MTHSITALSAYAVQSLFYMKASNLIFRFTLDVHVGLRFNFRDKCHGIIDNNREPSVMHAAVFVFRFLFCLGSAAEHDKTTHTHALIK